jgi:hypothetical protein
LMASFAIGQDVYLTQCDFLNGFAMPPTNACIGSPNEYCYVVPGHTQCANAKPACP